MTPSSRSVLHELLTGALIEIRAAVGGREAVSEEDRQFIFFVSNMAHNWPQRLSQALSDEDHDALLRDIWQKRGNAEDWLRERLRLLGVDPQDPE